MIADTWVDSIGAMCGLLAGYMIRYRCLLNGCVSPSL